MNHPLATGLLAGAGLGALGRHWFWKRARSGARAALRMGLTGGVDQVGLAVLQATGTRMLEGNRLAWRNDREVFDVMEAAIAAAQHSIHVDLYIWKPGQPGERFADLICRRAQQGLAVRILVDPMGSRGFERDLERPLREAGCEVRYFRPPTKRPFSLLGRNHRKLVVIDGRIGFTGGFGIAPEWAGSGASSPAWRDSNVEVEGPTVGQMQAAFAAHWLETGGSLLPLAEFERSRPAGGARAGYVTSMDVEGLSHARWVTHIAMMAARRRAWIANAYFVPPPGVLGALQLLPSRGVEVRLLLPALSHQDHPSVTILQRGLYPRLERSGIEVHEYQPSMMHAKTMLVDDRLVVVGSINLDFLSMEWLEEGCLIVDDRPFAAELERHWYDDLARSQRMTTPREPVAAALVGSAPATDGAVAVSSTL